MIYAVTTHSFLLVVEFDKDLKLKDQRIIDSGKFFGMTFINNDPARLLIVRKTQPGRISAENDDDAAFTIFQPEPRFGMIGSIPIEGEFGDIHQVTYARGGIYIANTKFNSIVFQGLEEDVRHEYTFGNTRCDINHPNSILPCGNQVFVLLHNKARRTSELCVFDHRLSEGFFLKRQVHLPDFCCHNIFVEDHLLYYNASLIGGFVVVDTKKGRVMKRLVFPGHTKGLSVTEDFFVTGHSQLVNNREKRRFTKGCLAIIDRKSLEICSIIDLNSSQSIGNINEIRCLSDPELAQSQAMPVDLNEKFFTKNQNNPIRHAGHKILSRLRRLQQSGKYPFYWSRIGVSK
jgi:hypothetical protein